MKHTNSLKKAFYTSIKPLGGKLLASSVKANINRDKGRG